MTVFNKAILIEQTKNTIINKKLMKFL